MRTRAFLSLIAHCAICALLAIAFLWVAALQLDFRGRFGPMLPFHSTNNYFAQLINSRAGSERLLDVLAALPKDEAVAVVYRSSNETDTFLAYIVTYFAWPRRIESFPVERANAASQLKALAATPVCATFFCGLTAPPNTEPLIPIGDRLVVAPRTGSEL